MRESTVRKKKVRSIVRIPACRQVYLAEATHLRPLVVAFKEALEEYRAEELNVGVHKVVSVEENEDDVLDVRRLPQ